MNMLRLRVLSGIFLRKFEPRHLNSFSLLAVGLLKTLQHMNTIHCQFLAMEEDWVSCGEYAFSLELGCNDE